MLDEYRRAGEGSDSDNFADQDFAVYIDKLHNKSKGNDLPSGLVPVTTFWLVKDNQIILGESRLRHGLTPALEEFGGHIGYNIRPSQRRKGYGTLLLALTLEKAGLLGMRRVRVTCDTDNIGSVRIIENNGGMLSGYGISPRSGKQTSQYWITL
jgi:predicted acetyltransferase